MTIPEQSFKQGLSGFDQHPADMQRAKVLNNEAKLDLFAD